MGGNIVKNNFADPFFEVCVQHLQRENQEWSLLKNGRKNLSSVAILLKCSFWKYDMLQMEVNSVYFREAFKEIMLRMSFS